MVMTKEGDTKGWILPFCVTLYAMNEAIANILISLMRQPRINYFFTVTKRDIGKKSIIELDGGETDGEERSIFYNRLTESKNRETTANGKSFE
ncbi:MAG: hypothetical protein LRY73_09070 [Bacillus sp. (in: Bacteria)]|nr:hypothetical protein [Bacillus sp. (in: firmicutes)]